MLLFHTQVCMKMPFSSWELHFVILQGNFKNLYISLLTFSEELAERTLLTDQQVRPCPRLLHLVPRTITVFPSPVPSGARKNFSSHLQLYCRLLLPVPAAGGMDGPWERPELSCSATHPFDVSCYTCMHRAKDDRFEGKKEIPSEPESQGHWTLEVFYFPTQHEGPLNPSFPSSAEAFGIWGCLICLPLPNCGRQQFSTFY